MKSPEIKQKNNAENGDKKKERLPDSIHELEIMLRTRIARLDLVERKRIHNEDSEGKIADGEAIKRLQQSIDEIQERIKSLRGEK